jgi:hypothetical protein
VTLHNLLDLNSMADHLLFKKVAVLPSPPYDPSTAYLVETANPALFDLYVSSSDGSSVKRIINTSDTMSVIKSSTAPTNTNSIWFNDTNGKVSIFYLNVWVAIN